MRAAPSIFVSAGEPSGDLHAAQVTRALLRRWPDARIEAFGGAALREAGASVIHPMEAYTVLGFLEALSKIPRHLRLLRQLRRTFRQGRYDLLLLVDYPGFNLPLAEAARAAGVRTLYYVAPQLWAWRPGRARRLGRAVDRLAVILPFEQSFFSSLGLRSDFVGHPLVERPGPSRLEARARLGIPETDRVLALFPGSRAQEIRRLWPVFRAAAALLLEEGGCDRVLVAGTGAGLYPGSGAMDVREDEAAAVLAAADAAIVKSGTTTLEAAMAGTPMVVAYRVNRLTALLARRLITVRWISLVNLVAGRAVVPELVQGRCTPSVLVEEVRPLLDRHSVPAEAQRQALGDVRERLGHPGAAERVAALVEELLAA